MATVVLLRNCYMANGGESGVKFSDKLVFISWVMLIRGFVFVFVPLCIIGSTVAIFVGISLGYNDEVSANLVENCVLGEALIFESLSDHGRPTVLNMRPARKSRKHSKIFENTLQGN